MTKAVFPYRVLHGDVVLRVEKAVIDGGRSVELSRIGDSSRIVALDGLQETMRRWSEVTLKVSVKVDGDELRAGPWQQPRCIAVASNRRTNVYHAFPLRQDAEGCWSGEVDLVRDEHMGRSEITARIVAMVDGVDGRLVGTAEAPWYVDFEAKRPSPERSIKIRWLDFTDSSNDHLKEYRNDPWLFDSEAGEPVLYLNSSVEGLRGVLENATTPEQKVVRELVSSQVASEAWSAMFNAAVYACEVVEGEPQWPDGWHEDVLRRMLPDLYPDLSPDEALIELVQGRTEGENGSDLQRRLMHGAGAQSRKPRKISSALRDLRRIAKKKENV
ncbi:hypothetical protein [Streptomyces sp. NPDC003077]|uniref:hypothetical protein n=1 Tax=Streptomyces sp. NPDC003077 TaxID=3154443 RepID=UPI0033B41844